MVRATRPIWRALDYQKWCCRSNVIGLMSHTTILCDGDLLCVVSKMGRLHGVRHQFVCEAHAAHVWPQPYRHSDLPIMMFSSSQKDLVKSVIPDSIEWPEPTDRTEHDDLRDKAIAEQRMSNANRMIDQYSWKAPYVSERLEAAGSNSNKD